MTTYTTLKKPLLTEKSLIERDTHNRYGFVVAKNASKGEIKTAVEKICRNDYFADEKKIFQYRPLRKFSYC